MKLGLWLCCLIIIGGLNVAIPGSSFAQEQPSAAQILDALKPKPQTRSVTRSLSGGAQSTADKTFVESLRNRQTRSITIEERTQAAEIAKAKPSIDLEITFDYNSDVIGPKAVPALVNLGTALRAGELKGTVFLINGHTDAKGDDAYNQALSERRAEAVRRFLVEKFSIDSANLVALGFGKSQLKNTADPLAGENRRVQIVNTEIK